MTYYLVINNGHGHDRYYVYSPTALISLRCHACDKQFTLNEWSNLLAEGPPVHKNPPKNGSWLVSRKCPCGHPIVVEVAEIQPFTSPLDPYSSVSGQCRWTGWKTPFGAGRRLVVP